MKRAGQRGRCRLDKWYPRRDPRIGPLFFEPVCLIPQGLIEQGLIQQGPIQQIPGRSIVSVLRRWLRPRRPPSNRPAWRGAVADHHPLGQILAAINSDVRRSPGVEDSSVRMWDGG